MEQNNIRKKWNILLIFYFFWLVVQWQYNQTLFSVSEIVRSAAAHVTNTLLTEN